MTIKKVLAVLFTASLLICAVSAAIAQTKTTPKAATKNTVHKPPKAGMVWGNTKSKIYHKEGDQWYGKGKNGIWMTEADAKKGGYRIAEANAFTSAPTSAVTPKSTKGATGSTGTTGKK